MKPTKSDITQQLNIFNSVQGKGPVDWAVVLVLTTANNMTALLNVVRNFDTQGERDAARQTAEWLQGLTDTTPAEAMGYVIPDERPLSFRRKIFGTLVIITVFVLFAMVVDNALGSVVTR
jgi:hypothetical protein